MPTVSAYIAGSAGGSRRRRRGPRYPYSFSIANHGDQRLRAAGRPGLDPSRRIAAAANEAQVAGRPRARGRAHLPAARRRPASRKQLVANGLIGLLGAVLGNDPQRPARPDWRPHPGRRLHAEVQSRRRARGGRCRRGDHAARRVGRARDGRVHGHPARASRAEARAVSTSSCRHTRRRRSALTACARRVRTGGTKDSAAFRNVKARLAKMPPRPA